MHSTTILSQSGWGRTSGRAAKRLLAPLVHARSVIEQLARF